MKARDVKPAMRNVDLELKVVEIEQPRSYVGRTGHEGKVTTAIGEDDSGRIKISLWDKDVDSVKVGSTIRIRSGYSRVFRDEVYVSAGMYGKLEVAE